MQVRNSVSSSITSTSDRCFSKTTRLTVVVTKALSLSEWNRPHPYQDMVAGEIFELSEQLKFFEFYRINSQIVA